MRKALLWSGVVLCALGVALIAASAVLSLMGLGSSINLGDAAKFEFVLVPVWLLGLGVAAAGAFFLLAWRWSTKSGPPS